jgi:hypothetical protein
MFKWLGIILGAVRAAMRCRHDLATENLTLRQQLAVMKYQRPRPRLTDADRLFWVVLSRIGQVGKTHFTSFSLKQFFAGTAKDFATTGAGRVVTEGGRRPILNSEH